MQSEVTLWCQGLGLRPLRSCWPPGAAAARLQQRATLQAQLGNGQVSTALVLGGSMVLVMPDVA